MSSATLSRRRGRLWRFANAEFDEAGWVLRFKGKALDLEAKPLNVLHELLLRAGDVVSKNELFAAVWPDVMVGENSLATAISKLRKALEDDAGAIIKTVPRIGYRLDCHVEAIGTLAPQLPRFAFVPGDTISKRPQWQLEKRLGTQGFNDVWLARHPKTREARVFKFAETAEQLRIIKREAALSRALMRGMGEAAPLPPLLEWNFETAPYFLEQTYGGDDLTVWAEKAGGLEKIPLEARLAVMVGICQAVAAIHSFGILHKDLKPENILISVQRGKSQIKLIDFGSGWLMNDSLLDYHRITRATYPDAEVTSSPSSGTLAYRAPELFSNGLPTIQSDVYALGLILYQLVAADFNATLAPGWELRVDDPLLREDICMAADVRPEHRLLSAFDLADLLQRLEQRREDARLAQEQQRALETRQRAESLRKSREPWVRAAIACLMVGFASSSLFAGYALFQRDKALQAQQIAEASYRFLAEDILVSVDPAHAEQAEETLVHAITRSGGTIAQRFEDQPLVAAHLYASLGRAFDMRSDYGQAFGYYQAALNAYEKAGKGDSPQALNTRLQYAAALALSTQPDSLSKSVSIVAAIREKPNLTPETQVWLRAAQGIIALVREDVTASRQFFGQAYTEAGQLPELFSARQVAGFGQRYAFSLLRLGQGSEAETVFRTLLQESVGRVGEDHPDTLLLRLNLGQAFMLQQRFDEALAVFDPLLPVMEKRLGRTHRHTLLLLSARQQTLGSMGAYERAAADGERVWQAAAQKDGVSSFAAVAGRTDTGVSLCRAGQLEAGAGHIQAALQALKAQPEGRKGLEDAVGAALADCYIQMQRFDEASALLASVDRKGVAELVGDANWGFLMDLALAEIAWGKKDVPRAKSLLQVASKGLSNTQDDYVHRRLERLRNALIPLG